MFSVTLTELDGSGFFTYTVTTPEPNQTFFALMTATLIGSATFSATTDASGQLSTRFSLQPGETFKIDLDLNDQGNSTNSGDYAIHSREISRP